MAEPVKSAHFAKYLELLNQLHALVRTGQGDSAEADALRDAMDELWLHLGQDEIAEAKRRSSQLHSQRDVATADAEVPLTQRESEVLRQLACGLTNKEIAQALDISSETVKEHVQHILRKIGVSDRTQAAAWAVRKELV